MPHVLGGMSPKLVVSCELSPKQMVVSPIMEIPEGKGGIKSTNTSADFVHPSKEETVILYEVGVVGKAVVYAVESLERDVEGVQL